MFACMCSVCCFCFFCLVFFFFFFFFFFVRPLWDSWWTSVIYLRDDPRLVVIMKVMAQRPNETTPFLNKNQYWFFITNPGKSSTKIDGVWVLGDPLAALFFFFFFFFFWDLLWTNVSSELCFLKTI